MLIIIKNQMKKRIKEWMDMFMMESGKEIKSGFGIHTKRNEKLVKES